MTGPLPRLVRHDWHIGGKTSHSYTLDCDCDIYRKTDPHKVPGVTTVLNALPGPPPSWGAQVAAEYAVNAWAELTGESILERVRLIAGAPDRARDEAADRGTEIHAHGEALIRGEAPDVPDELVGPVEAYARFADEWKLEPIATETPVALTADAAQGYGLGTGAVAGTADLWARVGVRGDAPALIDLKAGRTVQNKTGLQLAGYRFADLWQPDGPASETSKQPGDIELTYVAHIGPDAVRMLPVVAGPRELRALYYIRQSMLWQQRHDWWFRERGPEPLIGEAEQP